MKFTTIDIIKQLRQDTQVGIIACKKALHTSKGNINKAKIILNTLKTDIIKKKQ